MKTTGLAHVEVVTAITCDRCAKRLTENSSGWHEIVSIEFVAGYGSIFEDGRTVCVDLCQHCLKETLGPWLRIGARDAASYPNEHGCDTVHGESIQRLQRRATRAGGSSSDAISDAGAVARIEDSSEDAEGPQPRDVDGPLDREHDVPPPTGYQTWLHYAVDSMDTRRPELDQMIDGKVHKPVTRAEMKAAAQKELAQVLQESELRQRSVAEPMRNRNRTGRIEDWNEARDTSATTPVSIDEMQLDDRMTSRRAGEPDQNGDSGVSRGRSGDTRQNSPETWPNMLPVGREFGADSARFTRVLQRAVCVFGNPLDAVQWLTTSNVAFDGTPMERVMASEDGCEQIMEVLSDVENGNG